LANCAGEGKIVLAQKYKEMLLQLQKELKNAVDAGLTYKNDLLRVEVNLNEADLNITKARWTHISQTKFGADYWTI
jgi:hypothetical protein